jgi:hypothetical protein
VLGVDCILCKLRMKKVLSIKRVVQHSAIRMQHSDTRNLCLVSSANKENIHAVGREAARESYCLLDICTGWQLSEPF